jgi:hypothetical protein
LLRRRRCTVNRAPSTTRAMRAATITSGVCMLMTGHFTSRQPCSRGSEHRNRRDLSAARCSSWMVSIPSICPSPAPLSGRRSCSHQHAGELAQARLGITGGNRA